MKKKPQIPMWAKTGHQKPVTRRDFLAAGVLPFSAALFAPAWTRLLLPAEARAADLACAVSSSAGMIPFISINLAGGAAMAANFLPMGKDGAPIPSYDVMGLGDGKLAVEKEFGNATFAGLNNGALMSKMLEGIRATAGTSIAKTAFVGQCVRSRDDSNENRFAAAALLTSSGVAGSAMPFLGKVNHDSAIGIAPAPLMVRSFNDLNSSLQYAGILGTSLNAPQKSSLAKLISSLSGSQTRHLASMSKGKDIQKLVDCAGLNNIDIIGSGGGGVDPRADAQFGAQLNTLWAMDANTGANDQKIVFSSMIYNVLKGNSGAAAIDLGGYDYHDNSRTTGNQKDLEAGNLIGRVLATAMIMGKPVFIYVTSDGAVSSPKSAARDVGWSSDRGTAGASYMLYFDPAARKEVSSNQIGWFTDQQVADDTFITGGSPELATVAVMANYLQLNNKLALLDTIAPRAIEKLDLVLRFG